MISRISWIRQKFENAFNRAIGRSDKYWLSRIQGLIHVGANNGEERVKYQHYGVSVLWIEAIPEVYKLLCQNLEGFPNQTALNSVLTDSVGDEVSFFISSNCGKSSSIFEFGRHKEIWPEVDTSLEVKLKSATLESLMKAHAVDIGKYDAMLLDVQGAELKVLLGAQNLIQNFRFIVIEAADFESYKGGCTLADVDAFMKSQRFGQVFKRRFAFKFGVGSYYDVLYEREAAR